LSKKLFFGAPIKSQQAVSKNLVVVVNNWKRGRKLRNWQMSTLT